MTKAEKFILLVEDNEDDIRLTLRAFKKQLFTTPIVIARDGAEALDFLFGSDQSKHKNNQGFPTLILLDIKLPKVDGLEVLQRIRANEHTRYIPVVILTTSLETNDIQESYKLGANSYIQKPVDFEDFAVLVEKLELYWLTFNITPPSSLHLS